MTLPKDQTVRTDDIALRLDEVAKQRGAVVVGSDDALGDRDDCLTTNLNKGQKRHRTTAENSRDLARARPAADNLMGKIRVTQVDCSDLSNPAAKHASDSIVPQDCQSSFGGDVSKHNHPQ